MVAFAEIERASQDAAPEIANLVMAAIENANDTVYVEKARDASEFAEIAMASLEDQLCYYTGPSFVADWFEARGVRW